MENSIRPEDLVSDAWMNDPVAIAEFNKGLEAMDVALQPLQDMLDDSTRLTTKDWSTWIT